MSENSFKSNQPRWYFDAVRPGEVEQTSIADVFFSQNTPLDSIIREGIQNSLDARKDPDMPVRVRIYFSGNATNALDAKKMDQYCLGAWEHLNNQGSALRNLPEQNEKCPFIVLEDFNTTGLSGPVDRRPLLSENNRSQWNYYNYFFKESSSSKADDGKLGSWGTGKAIFMRASRIRMTFALSNRQNAEPQSFLAGRMILQIHTDETETTWKPHGWFGYEVKASNNIENTKRPITESSYLNSFSRIFHLERKDETGTSIVVPWLDLTDEDGENDFSQKKIAASAIRNFMVAILNGDLVIDIFNGNDNDSIHLDKETIRKRSTYLPAFPERESPICQGHLKLIQECLSATLPKDQQFELHNPLCNGIPELCKTIFGTLDLRELKKKLHDGYPLLFRVPMSIRKKTEGKKTFVQGEFNVYLARNRTGSCSIPAVFYRLGLLIPDVKAEKLNNCFATTLIPPGEVAKLLVAAEPPSHNEWKSLPSTGNNYAKPSQHINFVKGIAAYILSSIENSDNQEDWDLLVNDFGIPENIEEDENNKLPSKPIKREKRKEKDAIGDNENNKSKDDEETIIPSPILVIDKIEGEKTGFMIRMSKDAIVSKGFPFEAKFSLSYPPLAWSHFDFCLEDKRNIEITCDGETGIVDIEPCGNQLKLTIHHEGDFEICVTGFDPNRDLLVKGPRYKYPSEEA